VDDAANETTQNIREIGANGPYNTTHCFLTKIKQHVPCKLGQLKKLSCLVYRELITKFFIPP